MLVDSRAAQRVTEREVQHQRCAAVFAAARRDDKEIAAIVCVCEGIVPRKVDVEAPAIALTA